MSSEPLDGDSSPQPHVIIGAGGARPHDVAAFLEQSRRRKAAMSIDGLPGGWEHAEAALGLLYADVRRAFPDSPQVHLLWERDDEGEVIAYVGTGRDWFRGHDGGLHPYDVETFAGALVAVASDLADCLIDGMFGRRQNWPECPADRMPAEVDTSGAVAVWRCVRCGRELAEVGRLGA